MCDNLICKRGYINDVETPMEVYFGSEQPVQFQTLEAGERPDKVHLSMRQRIGIVENAVRTAHFGKQHTIGRLHGWVKSKFFKQ